MEGMPPVDDDTDEPQPKRRRWALPLFDRDRVVPGVSRRDHFTLNPQRCALLVIDVQRYLCPLPGDDNENDDTSSSRSAGVDRGCYSEYYQNRFPAVLAAISELLRAFRSIRDDEDTQKEENDPGSSSSQGHRRHRRRPGCEVIFTYLQALTADRRDVSLDYELSGPLLANIPTAVTDGTDDAAGALFLSPPVAPSPKGRGDLCVPKTSCGTFASTNLDYLLRQLQIDQLVVVGQMTDQCIESTVREAADRGYYVVVPSDACAATSVSAHTAAVERLRAYATVVDRSDQFANDLRAAAARTVADTAPPPVLTDGAVLEYLQSRGIDSATVTQVADALLRRPPPPSSPAPEKSAPP